ncbi:MAG: hypothetical protein AVDCRST_MAG89-4660, partial [uncultured Gemmatimonadetes bacterium]
AEDHTHREVQDGDHGRGRDVAAAPPALSRDVGSGGGH